MYLARSIAITAMALALAPVAGEPLYDVAAEPVEESASDEPGESPVPEPSFLLIGAAALVAGLIGRKRKHA